VLASGRGFGARDDRSGDETYDFVEVGLGEAGVGCESFTNMRADRSRDYLSPVRVTAAFSYAVEDEFGIKLLGSNPGDMKSAFGPLVIKELGMWIEGPDHVRDALGHVLFAIRKWG
jgi:hypothetical protein